MMSCLASNTSLFQKKQKGANLDNPDRQHGGDVLHPVDNFTSSILPRWGGKPIVCEMFLRDGAKATGLGEDGDLRIRWELLLLEEKQSTWPENGFDGGV